MKKSFSSSSLLSRSGYRIGECENLWVPKNGVPTFYYSDGIGAENNILDILKEVKDLGVDSVELAKNISDWPTEYHFSSKRANLLRPVSDLLQGNVLEIGAGCGAISRFIGECGAQVISLEGSAARARIAAERCRDLPNVTVVCDRLDGFSIDAKFDAVLLIGVLEYAKIFAPVDQLDPVQWMLDSARQLLNSDGCLIVAIENKLGLKYFSGCSEDHVGVPFYGVEGLYHDAQAVTFGRKELSEKLCAAGFRWRKLYLPFPDYKLTDIVLDADACERHGFDVGAFLGVTTGRDYSGPVPLAFSQALVWQALVDNGVVPEFSNSFLFVGSPSAGGLDCVAGTGCVLAWSFSSGRRPELSTNTRIEQISDGFAVFKEKRYPALVPVCDPSSSGWSQKIKEKSSYISGKRLDVALLRAVASDDKAYFFDLAQTWFGLLLSRSTVLDGRDETAISSWVCAGDSVDLIPRNIVVSDDGKLNVFDQEWLSDSAVPLAWVLVRGVLSFATLVINGSWVRSESVFSLARTLASRVSLSLRDEDLPEIQRADAEFLRWVQGGGAEDVVAWDVELLRCPLGLLNPSYRAFPGSGFVLPEEYRATLHNLEFRLEAERIDHAKLIGAYHASEKSNQSLIAELQKAHAYGAVRDERVRLLEAKLVKFEALESRFEAERLDHAKLIGSYCLLESINQAKSEEAENLKFLLNDSRAREKNLEAQCANLDKMLHDISCQLKASEALVIEQGKELSALENIKAECSALVESMAELEQLRKVSVSACDELAAQLNAERVQVAALRNSIQELEAKQVALNIELLLLIAERSTVGARIGRSITKARGFIAPLGTKRGLAVALLARFYVALSNEGLEIALLKTKKFLRFKAQETRSRLAKRVRSAVGGGRPSHGSKIEADHPQLSAWIEANESSAADLNKQREVCGLFLYKPLISVVLPIYKVPRDVLMETLASLEGQTYPHWQACIVWSDVEDLEGWTVLQRRISGDSRFSSKLLEKNGGISINSNAALELVEGEFVALLDHDDTLTPWAFYDVVSLLQSNPDLDFIYSDKDCITADGSIRLNALFKPEWSPEMLHSVNYLTHLNVIRTKVLNEVGGWRRETDGAQDWDLFFRVTERTSKIARIPSIHYHWRVLPTSTATGLQAKPYAAQGQLRAQQDYFRRRGLPAAVLPSPEGMFHVRWPVCPGAVDMIVFQRGSESQLVHTLNVLRVGQFETIARIHVYIKKALSPELNAFKGVWGNRISFTELQAPGWQESLIHALPHVESRAVILADGSAAGFSETLINELSGWVLNHPEIAWTGSLALHPDGTVFEAGRVVSDNMVTAPLFAGSSLFAFGWFGGPLWYRNVSACSPYAVAFKVDQLRRVLNLLTNYSDVRSAFAELCVLMRHGGLRGLVNPFSRVYFNDAPEHEWNNDASAYFNDPYFNPSFVSVSPLCLSS